MSNYEITNSVTAALETAVHLTEEDDWNEEMVEEEEGRKIFLCTATVNVPPKILEAKLMDIENLPSWNSTVTESRVLKKPEEECVWTYQVTAEGGGGLVSARDFV